MNRVFVTGASGFLGKQLVLRLANGGHQVHALYRSESKISGWKHENITFFKGRLGDKESLRAGIMGCSKVYHLASYSAVWDKDPDAFYRHNVGGTENLLEICLELGVDRLVYTSTAGVFGPSNGDENTEEKVFGGRHMTLYDDSKAKAEGLVLSYNSRGLKTVVVNPSRIYGPGQ